MIKYRITMIKYRIKEITYGNGNKQYNVECQQKFKIGDSFLSINQFLLFMFTILITLGAALIVFVLNILYYSIFPEWEYLQKFDTLDEAQLYIEQEEERDKEVFDKKVKAEELKKAQKIVSERVVKLREKDFELKD